MFAQTKDTLPKSAHRGVDIEFAITHINLFSKPDIGGIVELKFFHKKWGYGVYGNFSGEVNTKDTFSYVDKEPRLSYVELGFVNQYCIYSSGKFYGQATLVIGEGAGALLDKSVQVPYTYRGQTNYRDKEVATSRYFLLEPGIDVNFKLAPAVKSKAGIFLTGKIKYRFQIGPGSFASPQDFSGLLVGIAISLMKLPVEYP